jgi:hypothetical protein
MSQIRLKIIILLYVDEHTLDSFSKAHFICDQTFSMFSQSESMTFFLKRQQDVLQALHLIQCYSQPHAVSRLLELCATRQFECVQVFKNTYHVQKYTTHSAVFYGTLPPIVPVGKHYSLFKRNLQEDSFARRWLTD